MTPVAWRCVSSLRKSKTIFAGKYWWQYQPAKLNSNIRWKPKADKIQFILRRHVRVKWERNSRIEFRETKAGAGKRWAKQLCYDRVIFVCDSTRRIRFWSSPTLNDFWMSHEQACSKATFTRILVILGNVNRWNGPISLCGSSIPSWSEIALRLDLHVSLPRPLRFIVLVLLPYFM